MMGATIGFALDAHWWVLNNTHHITMQSYLMSHLVYLVPFGIARLADNLSTKYWVGQYLGAGIPKEEVSDYERGRLHKKTLELRYGQNRKVYAAFRERGEDVLAFGLALAFPEIALGYALMMPMVVASNLKRASGAQRLKS